MTQITPYDEVNNLLQSIILKLHASLNNNLTGVYLYDSLTWGDFNEQIAEEKNLQQSRHDLRAEYTFSVPRSK
jgi:hypothetical protein